MFNAVTFSARKHKRALITRLGAIIDRGTFLSGPENKLFEQNIKSRLGGGFVTPVASGHDALLLALLALRPKSTDEVLFPVNAYPTAFPIALAGVRPVPVDVDDNGQLDPKALEQAITPQTKAVIAVHLYGLIGELGVIKKICQKKKLVLIEDCAQAFGSTYHSRPAGTLGDIGCFSFYPTKNLGALGDGGAIWTKNKKWYEFFLAAKAYGEKTRYESEFISGHSRLPELQAGALNVYLGHFDNEAGRRRSVWALYDRQVKKAHLDNFLRLLISNRASDPVPHLLVVDVDRRDGLRQFLVSRGIPTLIHYPTPVHLVAAFAPLHLPKGSFPCAERLAGRILSLPFHPYLTRGQVYRVVQSIREYYHG